MKKIGLTLLAMFMTFSVSGNYTKVNAETLTEAQKLLNDIRDTIPSISDGKIVLPTISNEDYRVEIGGSSNEAVIDESGNVYTPLESMNVNIMYRVVKKSDNKVFAFEDNKDVVLTVPGKYIHDQDDNKRPEVMPGLREWKGKTGQFTFNSKSRIVAEDDTMKKAGENIAYYFKEMIDRDIPVVVGQPIAGDVYIKSSIKKELGNEGNYIEIDDKVTIEANSITGALYGGATLTQILTQDADHDELPKGLIRDYPAYKIRAGMLDVARFYMPIDYLEELTKYMAYFKLNELQVHINDDGGEQAASFRVESKKYPLVNSGLKKDEVYTQDQYRQYQKNVAPFGIDVITEIDTPAHCRFVGLYDKSLMLDDSHIDLKNPDAVKFVQNLCDEFLDGEDPVFQSKKFHVGADEYQRGGGHDEDFVQYLNKMIEYVNDKGLEARMWASLGGGGMNGTTPVDTRVTANYWAYSWANFPKMIQDGFKCINTSTDLYIVPGTSTGYVDYIDLKKLYNTWSVNTLGGGTNVSPAHPLLEGGQSALWYDRQVGMSQFDYFDRFRDQVMLVSEKTWFGNKEESQTADDFIKRIGKVDQKAPGSNPGRYVESKDETVINYDFNQITENKVSDKSGNHYDATVHNLELTDSKSGKALNLDGQGYLELPFDSIGFPYTLSMDLYVDKNMPENSLLFKGKDGALYLNYQGTGKIGYERKGYKYIIDCEIETGRWQNILLTCNFFGMNLYIDNVFEAAARYNEDKNSIPESSTFILPTEKIGEGVIGKIDNLKITNKFSSKEEMTGTDSLDYRNLALEKMVEVSSVGHSSFLPEYAVDGNSDTNLQLGNNDQEWFYVDLGETYQIDKIEVDFTEKPNKYSILVSKNGEDWTQVHEDLECIGKSKGTDIINLDEIMSVRYIKYQQLERFSISNGEKYSGNISEFRAFGYAGINALNTILQEAKDTIDTTNETTENKIFLSRLQKNIKLFEEALNNGTMEEKCWIGKQIKNQTERLTKNQVNIPTIDLSKLEELLKIEIDQDNYDQDTLIHYNLICKNTRYAMIDVDADQAKINSTARKLKDCINQMLANSITITSNKTAWKDEYALSNMIDGDINTQMAISSNQELGDYYLFTMRFPLNLKNIHVISSSDLIAGADVEVSSNGSDWKKVGSLTKITDQKIEFAEVEAKYMRFVLTATAEHWLRIDEVVFNEAEIIDTSRLVDVLKEVYESNIYTPKSYTFYTTAKTNAEALLETVGFTQKEVDDAYEALVKAIEKLVSRASTTLLKDKIKEAEKVDLSLYTEETVNLYNIAFVNANTSLEDLNVSQTDVDKALADLTNAINQLMKKGDKSNLIKLINEAQKINKADYTEKTYKVLSEAIDNAQAVIKDDNATQSQIEKGILDINDAVNGLVKQVNKSSLVSLIDIAKKIKKTDYTDVTIKNFENALKSAQVILDNLDVKQKDVDESYDKLKTAMDSLEKKKPVIEPENPDSNSPVLADMTVKNSDNTVSVSGNLPKGIELKTNILKQDEVEKMKLIMNKNNSKYLINASLENIFDLNLLMDGKSYQPNTEVSVSLKLDKDLLSKKLSIIYIDELGNITVIPSVVKDEYITFETTHFSYYGIVAYNEKKSDEVKTSDECNNALPFILMIGAIVVICSLVMKKKKED